MAKRGKKLRPGREKSATVSYTDPEGNVLVLRETLSGGSIRKLRERPRSAAASIDDAWARREEALFERLTVSWEVSGLPLDDQKMLLGRYRMATPEERAWVRRTIAEHLERHIPELAGLRPAVMAEELRIDERLAIPLAEIELRASRSSGPGGQHANVTASRVEAVFDVEASRSLDEARRVRLVERLGPVVTAVAQDGRSQYRNRELALSRLAAKIAGGLRTQRRRRPTRPTNASRRRRLEQKRRTGERKQGRRRWGTDD